MQETTWVKVYLITNNTKTFKSVFIGEWGSDENWFWVTDINDKKTQYNKAHVHKVEFGKATLG